MTTSRLLLSALLVPVLAVPSGAQRVTAVALRASDAGSMPFEARSAAPYAAAPDTVLEPAREISPVRTILGGVVGGVAGTFLGMVVGVAASQGCQGDLCGLTGALAGMLIGEPLGLAIGAHVGSRSRQHDRVMLTSLASAGILVGGLIAGVELGRLNGGVGSIMIPLTPALQLATAMAIEGH
jgi:hypothetical protein